MENTDVETESVKYPVKVDYCPNCSMPFEVRCEMLIDCKGQKLEIVMLFPVL